RRLEVAPDGTLLRLDLWWPLPRDAQALGLRRGRHHGPAAAPSYLLVTETGAELREVPELWGRATRDAVQALVGAEGPEADAIAIGPAGEQRVRFAAMAHYWKNREGVSGRGGLGAVLGAKHLKADGVTGT